MPKGKKIHSDETKKIREDYKDKQKSNVERSTQREEEGK